MDTMKNFTFVLISIWLITVPSDAYCSNLTRCECYPYKSGVLAKCVGLGIRDEDDLTFDSNVINIDLGSNFLKHIPRKLPSNLQILNLTDNLIEMIGERSLENYTKLNHLVISYCKIRRVRSGAFQKLKQLQTLDISNNQELTISAITNISKDLQHSAIKSLNFEKLQCTYGITRYLTKEHMKYLQNTSLEQLNVAGNKIGVINVNVLQMLPKTLIYLNIADNALSFGYYLLQFNSLTNLRILNASFQDTFHEIHRFHICKDDYHMEICEKVLSTQKNVESKEERLLNKRFRLYVASVGKTHMQNRSAKINITVFLPPKLEKIYFSDCLYRMSLHGVHIRSAVTPMITHVHLQNNIFYEWKGPVLDFTNVIYVDLSNNLCTEVSVDFFNNVDSIEELNLSHNILGTSLDNDISGNIFKGFRKLKNIDLSYNRIVVLPKNIFHQMNNMEELNMSNNKLTTFDINFSHMRNLSYLDLSNNSISVINEDTRTIINNISKSRSVRLNLLGNNLRCTCKEIDFIRWLNNPSNINFTNVSRYKCVYLNSSFVSLENLPEILRNLERSCASYTVLTVLATSFIVISLTCTICAVIYRYRWSLQYWYYVAKRENRPSSRDFGNIRYKYHAFISYAQGNVDFVLNHIVPYEQQNGLRFLIHDRDFIPGVPIADNITNAIHSSKRTICIVTPHFLKSQWCKFELNMARMESVYSRHGEGTLMLIILDKSIVKQMPIDMVNIVENQSYLEYPDETVTSTRAFWNQFSQVINT